VQASLPEPQAQGAAPSWLAHQVYAAGAPLQPGAITPAPRASALTPEVVSFLRQALMGQARHQHPTDYLASLPSGYGLERLRREGFGKELNRLPTGEVWRLASGAGTS
jgi:hypothetical protein